MRARFGALLAGAIIVASCGSPAATPPTAPGSSDPTAASPTAGASPASPSAAPSTSEEPDARGAWRDAGTMTLGRRTTHAILMGDGRVLVVGNDDFGCVRDDSVRTDIWDPTTASWSAGPSLNKPRGEFAAVALAGGPVLVTGGVNAGTSTVNGYQDGQAAYSSTYVYDPAAATSGWTKVALLVNARVAPAAVALPDGRVLAVGGFYATGELSRAPEDPGGVVLAGFVPGGERSDHGRLDNMDPIATVPSLATAELYDPTTDSWSATGQMRYARIDPDAVTLADGRVLIVGSRDIVAFNGVSGRAVVDEDALDSAEIYDPATGRFSSTSDLPAPDWSAFSTFASSEVDPWQPVVSGGTLVALANGGALLVGRSHEAYTVAGDFVGRIVRTLLFDPAAVKWVEIDRWMVAEATAGDSRPREMLIEGHLAEGAMAVTLADGTVLAAGGIDPMSGDVSAAAWRFDLTAMTLTALPEMPTPRAWGTAVALPDGSALLLAGRSNTDEPSHCGTGETGLATALRYVP